MSANFPSRQANININFWVVGEGSTLWFFGPEFSIGDPKTLSFYHSMFSCNSIPRYVFRSPGICFWGTKYDVYCLRVGYLYSILWCRARLWLELFASTVGGFLSRVSYLPSYVFFGDAIALLRESNTLCLEKFLCFLQLSDRAYVRGARFLGLLLFWSLWYHRIQI